MSREALRVEFGEVGGKIVCEFDHIEFKMLMVQTAACVIDEIQTAPIDGYPSERAGGILRKRTRWGPQGYVNAIQSQVEFLYGAIPVAAKKFSFWEKSEAELVTEALEKYQAYKTQLVEEGYRKFGEHWGDSTGFNKADWADRNEIMLAPFTREEAE